MPEISATDFARNLSEILDGVEHRGESYTVVRHGRAVAHLAAAPAPNGARIKQALRSINLDPGLAEAVEEAPRLAAEVLPPDPWAE